MRLISAAAAILIVCRAADRGQATVVRDEATAAGNPAVATGGHRPEAKPPIIIQFDITSGFQSQGPWFAQCTPWPWSPFSPLFWHRRGNAGRVLPRLPGFRGAPFFGVPPRLP
nr:hypothetical protein [uncultured Rhodopila sp.]